MPIFYWTTFKWQNYTYEKNTVQNTVSNLWDNFLIYALLESEFGEKEKKIPVLPVSRIRQEKKYSAERKKKSVRFLLRHRLLFIAQYENVRGTHFREGEKERKIFFLQKCTTQKEGMFTSHNSEISFNEKGKKELKKKLIPL